MTRIVNLPSDRGFVANTKSLLGQSWKSNKPLTIVGIGSALLLLLALVGVIIDPTRVLSEPAWLKPAKFALSISIYSLTFIWLLSFVRRAPRTVAVLSWITAVMFVIEIGIIFYQASQGVRSHFNNTTPLDALLFSTMGAAIFTLWAASAVAAGLIIREPIPGHPAFVTALRLGLVLAVIGSGLGALMTIPTAEQRVAMAATGTATQFIGAHSVGVEDGGPGLPVVGWSTTGGDLRAGHFVGLHAMQIIPLLGFLIVRAGRQERRWTDRQQAGLVWSVSMGYLGLMALLTWQALRGQPLLAPDILTLVMAGLLILATGGGIAYSLKQR